MEVGYWCRIPAADENENVRPPLTLTLSHQGAREIEIWNNKSVPSPWMGEGEDEGGI